MKKIYIYLLCLLTLGTTTAQIDRSIQPKPGPPPEINLENPQSFQLKNGLTVLVVENHKLPRAFASLRIDNKPFYEGEKAGVSDLLSKMLGKGSLSISKDDFEEEIDFLGARVNFGSESFYASSLSRYFPRVLEMSIDAAINPNFLEEEFENEKNRLRENLESDEKSVTAAARRVESLLAYGKKHPYGEYISKETLKNVSLADVKNLYADRFKASNAYLVIVGDVNYKTIKKQITKAFKNWKGQVVESAPFPEPDNVAETEINFVEMPNAVQSEVSVINTATMDKKNPDYFASLIANRILGGGGQARLFLNLREDKGYTYGSYSNWKESHKTKALFKAFASVRNAVTDSAIVELVSEVDRIGNELVTDKELATAKAKYAGNFVLSLEDPKTIAQFALNIKTQKLNPEFYINYLKNINAVSKEDVIRVSKKYFLSNQSRIVVTGKGSEILENIEKVDFKGRRLKVRYFDKFGTETDRPEFSKPLPKVTTVKTVIEGYLQALGGREKLSEVTSIETKAEASMQGMKIEVSSRSTSKYQLRVEVSMMGNVMQKTLVNSKSGYNEMQGQKMKMNEKEFQVALKNASIFPELSSDFETIKLMGIVDVDGVAAYEIKWSDSKTIYFSTKDFLKIKAVDTIEMGGQSQSSESIYSDYKSVNGILFPHKTSQTVGPQKIDFVVQSVRLNQKMEDQLFE